MTETETATETETESETETETETEADTGCTEHIFGNWRIDKEPSCTEEGRRERICECGYAEFEVIAMIDHQYGDWALLGAPSCDQERTLIASCSCGDQITKTEPPTGHNEIITRGMLPNEVMAGYTDSVYCDVCNNTVKERVEVDPVTVTDADILANVTYEGDNAGNLKFHWKVNEAYKDIFLGMWVSVKHGSNTTTYEIMDSDGIWEFKATGGLSRFEFTFSPITAEGEQGNDKLIYFYWFPDVYEMEFPRVEIHTLDGELPTYTRVDCPPGCWGAGITDAEYVQSIVSVYSASNTLLYTSESSGFDGAKIKVRGNTSALSSKKPFKIKLSKKHDLLSGLIDRDDDVDYRSKDWLLMKGGYLSNIAVGSAISELVGNAWTPQYTYVTLFVNGEYRGLYLLMESVEDGEARCNVSDDGYIVEMDAYWWKEPLYITTPISENRPAKITFKHPDSDDVTETDESVQYIKKYLTDLENVMLGKTEGDINDYLDMRSFVKWMLTHDILASYDSGGSNMYMTKYDNTPGSKMMMGPVWDLDSIYWSHDKFKTDTFARIRYEEHFYMSYLADDPDFIRIYKEEYDAIRNEVASKVAETLEFFKSDVYATLLQLEKKRWNTGIVDQNAEAEKIIAWFEEHLAWMDENVPAPPANAPETQPEIPENNDENKGEWDVQ